MDSRLEFFEREIAHRSMHPWFCRNERCQMKPGRVDMEVQAIAHPSVSVASSSFVGPSVLAHFHLQTVVDEVKSSWTKAYCTLHFVSPSRSTRIWFSVAGGRYLVGRLVLTPFCVVSLPLLKLRTQLNTVLLSGAFSPRISDNK